MLKKMKSHELIPTSPPTSRSRPPFPPPPPPPHPQGIIAMLKKMKSRELDIPPYLALTPSCLRLLHRLLDPEPATRITVAEIMEVRCLTGD
jgi:hypothetical protein